MNVCMVGYAQYSRDARVKSYVKTLQRRGARVDLFVLQEADRVGTETIGSATIHYTTRPYRGDSPVRYILAYLRFFLSVFVRITAASLSARYDAVHVHNMPNLLVFTAILPRLLGARVILDVHDLMMANYMAKFGVDERHLMVRCLGFEQRLSALVATHVICADHMQRDFLETVCRIPTSKLTVVLNLPNEETFTRVPKEGTDDVFKLVYHGTIAHRLGIDIMLQAVAKIDSDLPVKLSIYGAGDFLPHSMKLADDLGLQDRVYFSGSFFPVEKVPQIVCSMDLGVIGNRRNLACDRFMLPVKLLEYVYLGIPVVAPRLEVIRHYFDEDMVKFYEPENVSDLARCIEELYHSPNERAELAQRAFRFYRERNWNTQAEQYWRILHGSLSTGAAAISPRPSV